jgi:iron(III) transport system substrate-binding protein
MRRQSLKRLVSALCIALAGSPVLAQAAEVNLYSARKEELIKPLLDRFTQQTGIKVNLVTGKEDALLQRLQSEGGNSPADLFLTTDAGRLHRAKQAGVLQAAGSTALDQAVPAHYRDSDGQWYGLSVRARVVMYAKDRVKPEQLSTYADLADPKWKGKICVRSSDNIYNQSQVAALIAHQGEAKAEAWSKGLVANLARKPAGGDRDQIKAVAAGECDIALANTYYLGGMVTDPDQAQRDAAAQVAVFWPDQDGHGVHVNVSGAGVTKGAKNKAEAVKLLEFLAGDEAQQWYAEQNHEYPVKAGIAIPALLEGWGTFKADDLPMSKLGELNPAAVKVMDRAGWQ